jgi:uncharacterized Tic20 family protein
MTGSSAAMGPSLKFSKLSILAHLSMFLDLFTGFLGPVAALIIWLVYKDR